MNVDDLNDYPIEQSKSVLDVTTALPWVLRAKLDKMQERVNRQIDQDKRPAVNEHRRVDDG